MHVGARCSTILLMVGVLGLLPRCVESDGVSSGAAGAADGGEAAERGGASSAGSFTNPAGTSSVAGVPDGGASEATAGAAAGGTGARANDGGEGGVTGGHAGSGDSQAGEAGASGGDTQTVSGPRCEPPGEYCRQTLDCPWYSRCDDQHCVAVAEGTPCVPVVDCGKAAYCDGSQCKHRPVTNYDCTDPLPICTPGTNCYWFGYHGGTDPDTMLCVDPHKNTGFCDHGLIPCDSNYYCPLDEGEFGQPPVCVAKAQLGEGCVDAEPGSCAAGLSCNFYKCQQAEAPVGTACEFEVGVRDGNSDSYREYDARYAQPCATETFCKFISADDRSFLVGECTPQKPSGADCEDSFECLHGYCDSSRKCAAPALGTNCGYPDYCPAGSTCYRPFYWYEDRSKCVPTLNIGEACRSVEGSCEPGSACDVDTGTCRKVAKLGQSCDDAVCSTGAICVANP